MKGSLEGEKSFYQKWGVRLDRNRFDVDLQRRKSYRVGILPSGRNRQKSRDLFFKINLKLERRLEEDCWLRALPCQKHY